eukprot:m.31525 g.31525  ORF g.31525 m.31525 type:complete len:557 (-) comp4889_c0_seq1:198-1868(-)
MGTDSMKLDMLLGASRSIDSGARHKNPKAWAHLVLELPPTQCYDLLDTPSYKQALAQLPTSLVTFFEQQVKNCRPMIAETLSDLLVRTQSPGPETADVEFIEQIAEGLYDYVKKFKSRDWPKVSLLANVCMYSSLYAEINAATVLEKDFLRATDSHHTTSVDVNLVTGHFALPKANTALACLPTAPVAFTEAERIARKKLKLEEVDHVLVTHEHTVFKYITYFPQKEVMLWLSIVLGSVRYFKESAFEEYAHLLLDGKARLFNVPNLANLAALKPDGSVSEGCTLMAMAQASVQGGLKGTPVLQFIETTLRQLGFPNVDLSLLETEDRFAGFRSARHPFCAPAEMSSFDQLAEQFPDATVAFLRRPPDQEEIDIVTIMLEHSSARDAQGHAKVVMKSSAENKDRKITVAVLNESVDKFCCHNTEIHFFVVNQFGQAEYRDFDCRRQDMACMILQSTDDTFSSFKLEYFRPCSSARVEKLFIIVALSQIGCIANPLHELLQRHGFADKSKPVLRRAQLIAFLDSVRKDMIEICPDFPPSLSKLSLADLLKYVEMYRG